MAKLTNLSGRRFYSASGDGFRLMPNESMELTTVHALCYLGNPDLLVEFDASDSFNGIAENRILVLKRVLGLDESLDVKGVINHLKPKRKKRASLPRTKSIGEKKEKPTEETVDE